MISRVAVGTDGSPTAAEAVDAACEIAERFEAEVVLISAFREDGSSGSETEWASTSSSRVREILNRTENGVRRRGIACRTMIDEGAPADVIVRLAGECQADLLVIGNKGMGRRILGSVPNTVTHKAPCSVLVVKTT